MSRVRKITSPGDKIREEMNQLGWKQQELADVLGLSIKHLNEILNGKKHFSYEVARSLSAVFGKTPSYWIRLDAKFRDSQESSKPTPEIEEVLEKKKIFQNLPIQDMKKRGWIRSQATSLKDLKNELCSFFGLKEFSDSEFQKIALPAFRATYQEPMSHSIYAWFQRAKSISSQMDSVLFDRQKFEELFNQIHSYMEKPELVVDWIHALKSIGVKFFILPYLTRSYVSGAAFMDKSNPVIVLSMRYNRMDHIVFTLLHEMAHIQLHSYLLFEGHIDLDNNNTADIELEANEYAANLLKANDLLSFVKNLSFITDTEIEKLSIKFGLHVSIIRGILANKNLIGFNRLNKGNVSLSKYLENFVVE